MITARAFAGKHYAVYGLARSGLATVEALLASGAKVTAWDSNEDARAKLPDGAEPANLDEADLSQFDSLVVSPGVPLNRHPIARRARDAGDQQDAGSTAREPPRHATVPWQSSSRSP